MQRAFVYADANGVQRTLIADNERPDQFVVKTSQDVEPILDSVARDRETMAHNGVNKLAARIPTIIYEDLIQRGVADDEDAFKAWLNSPEAEPFRIWRGRL